MTEFKFSTFSIVSNRNNEGIAIMALSDRPEVSLNEFQVGKSGFETDVRYQQIMAIASTMPNELVQVIISKLNSQLTANQGS